MFPAIVCDCPASTITVEIAPGPASMGIASGVSATSSFSCPSDDLLGALLRRALAAKHVHRHEPEYQPAGNAKCRQRDPEHLEDSGARDAEHRHQHARGDARAERSAVPLLAPTAPA